MGTAYIASMRIRLAEKDRGKELPEVCSESVHDCPAHWERGYHYAREACDKISELELKAVDNGRLGWFDRRRLRKWRRVKTFWIDALRLIVHVRIAKAIHAETDAYLSRDLPTHEDGIERDICKNHELQRKNLFLDYVRDATEISLSVYKEGEEPRPFLPLIGPD